MALSLTVVFVWAGEQKAAGNTGARHGIFTTLLQTYVSDGLVDYNGFGSDERFDRYLSQLASMNPDTISDRDDELALWINAYNAYTIRLIIDRMPLSSIRDIGLGLPVLFGPWSIEIANVGGTLYTLNAIEHDIIREKFRDSRVHFALVCASKSCPKLRPEAYEGATLDRQLDEDARRFIGDGAVNRFDVAQKRVYLSKIFDWYRWDFEEDAGSVRLFLAKYLPPGKERDLLWSDGVETEYFPYDWSLNAKEN